MTPSGQVTENMAVDGIALWDAAESENLARVLPTRVIWPGLLANVAVFAGVPFFVHQGWFMLRTRRARTRHLCPSCNYSRHGLDTAAACPECGTLPTISC